MTLNFPKSIYTKGEATTANIGNSNPNDGDTGTIGSYGFTFDSDRVDANGRWVMNNGSTYSLTGGATYTWDLYKWKASNIPDSSTAVQTSDNPSDGEVLTYDGTLGVNVWAPAAGGVPASGGTFTGEVDFDSRVTQAVHSTSWDIDCSAGNYFVRSMTGNTTFVFSNPPASGTAYSFVLELDLSSAVTAITWPSSVKWPGDTAPTFTVGNKTHLFFFVTDNGGTRWRGAALLDYVD